MIRDLIGDASSDGCECAAEISDRQILSTLADHRTQVMYERANTVATYAPGGGISYSLHRFQPYLAGNAKILDASYTEISTDDIVYSDPLHGTFETGTSRLTVYIVGDRYDVYSAAADLLLALRIRKRSLVDTSEMGVSIKLSQSLAVMESVERSLRAKAPIRTIEFGRSDIA